MVCKEYGNSLVRMYDVQVGVLVNGHIWLGNRLKVYVNFYHSTLIGLKPNHCLQRQIFETITVKNKETDNITWKVFNHRVSPRASSLD